MNLEEKILYFKTMSTYSIDQFSKITNIPKINLRTWEKIIRSRVYNDELLIRGINTKLLLENGYKISKISKMTDNELQLF